MSILSQAKKIFAPAQKPKKEAAAKPRAKKESAAKKVAAPKKKAVLNTIAAGELGLSVVLSEKSIAQQAANTVVVRVRPTSSKPEIAKAVEDLFGVKALSVRTVKLHPKTRRRGMTEGRTMHWKKAYITVDDISKLNVAP